MESSHAKRFVKTSGIYFVGGVLTKLITFFLLPIYTAKLLPADYGVYDLYTSILNFAAPIIFFQIWDAMYRFGFERHKSEGISKVFTNSFMLFILGGILFSIVFVPMCTFLNIRSPLLVYFYGIGVALQYFFGFLARVELKNSLYAGSGVINTLINSLMSVALILFFSFGSNALFVSSFFGNVVQTLIIIIVLRPWRYFKFSLRDKQLQADMLKFSIPLCIASTAYWLLSGFTRIIVNGQLGFEANGILAVADKFSFLIIMVMTAFQYAWNELVYVVFDHERKKEIYERGIDYASMFILFGTAALVLVVKLIFGYLVANQYSKALGIIPIAMLATSVNLIATFIGTLFMAEKKTAWILWTTLFAAIINILSAYFATSYWGLYGALGSLALSFVVLLFIRIWLIHRKFDVAVNIYHFVVAAGVVAISYYVFYCISNMFILCITIVLIAIAFVMMTKSLWALAIKDMSKILKRRS